MTDIVFRLFYDTIKYANLFWKQTGIAFLFLFLLFRFYLTSPPDFRQMFGSRKLYIFWWKVNVNYFPTFCMRKNVTLLLWKTYIIVPWTWNELSQNKLYFLSITYEHCNNGGWSPSIQIVNTCPEFVRDTFLKTVHMHAGT